MKTGDKIKVFEDTDIRAYINWVNSKGFYAHYFNGYIYIGDSFTANEKKRNKIARSIRKSREKTGLSIEELANKIGVRETTVFNWERGYSKPSEVNQGLLKQITGWEGIEDADT